MDSKPVTPINVSARMYNGSAQILSSNPADSHGNDCDCACPDASFSLDFRRSGSGVIFAPPVGYFTIPLRPGFTVIHSPFSSGTPSVLNAEAFQRFKQFCIQPRSLIDELDEQLAAYNLIVPVGDEPSFEPGSQITLTAWLHVTNACNLDCPYCYVRKSSARMTEEIGALAISKLVLDSSKAGFKRLKVKYAGGEASLHYKLVQKLHEQAMLLSVQSNIELQEVLLTNGVYLREDFVDWLVAAKVNLMISLDGIGDKHDKQRPTKNGISSYESIEKTVDQLLLPKGVRPEITVTITQLNADGIDDVVKWILARDLSFSLNFYRQNMQSKSRADLVFEEQSIINGMKAAYKVIEENLPTRQFFNGLLDRVQGIAHTHTCSVGSNYVVITHEGKLAQCQMHLDQPIAHIKDIESFLPVIATGPIKNISVDEKVGCRECEFRYLCTGGCPIETFRATGRWDVQSPNCNIYKALLPEAIRLEGLRLLKIHGYL
jgi:uncharacterized protein